MNYIPIDEEVIVHPIDGAMQLSEGYIHEDGKNHFEGWLPSLGLMEGDSLKEVLARLEKGAKEFFGDDVVVELVPHLVA
ncbi:MAG TPA: hypothetical protein VIR63_00990 [Pontiella sp.]